MDIEYHFYITYVIALQSGFDKETAYKVAYSSQYTDDNDTPYKINEGKEGKYESFISQTLDILKPKDILLRIHPFFHFFPGTEQDILKASIRRDGKLHLMNTTPGNNNAENLLKDALKSDNPYRIGLATHTFADTYAHQNFVGVKESFNAMGDFLQRLNIINIGHADAGTQPDKPGLIWDDNRLVSKKRIIDNKGRFLKATGHIFDLFSDYLMKGTSSRMLQKKKRELINSVDSAVGRTSKHDGDKKDKRLNRYIRLIGSDLISDYDEKEWFKEAVQIKYDLVGEPWAGQKRKRKTLWKENYKNSDWFNFQEAVKANQRKAAEILSPVLEKMEIMSVQNW